MSALDCIVWIGPQAIEAGVACAGRWRPEGAWRAPLLSPATPDEPPDHAMGWSHGLQALAAHWAEPGRLPPGPRSLWVGVADHHVATATLPWSPLVLREALWPSLAQAQLLQAGHEPRPGDVLRLGEGPAGAARLVLAVPESLLTALQALAHAALARPMSLLPASVLAWRQALLAGDAHGAGAGHNVGAWPLRRVSGQTAVMGVLLDGQALVLHGARALAQVDAQTVPQWPAAELAGTASVDRVPQTADAHRVLIGLWRRVALRLAVQQGMAADAAYVGTAPPAVTGASLPVLDVRSAPPEPDRSAPSGLAMVPWPALRPAEGSTPGLALVLAGSQRPPEALDAWVRSTRWVGWRRVAVAAGVLLLSALLMDNASRWQDRRAAAAQRAPDLAALVPPTEAPALSREELAQVQHINEAVRRLNLPVERVLTALQPPPDIPVAVLSIDLRAAAPAGRNLSVVRALAPLGADMSRYVAHVGTRAPFTDAHLRQHERRLDDPAQPYLFTLEAAWTP